MSTRRYEVLLPLQVHTETATYEQHDIFEHEFTAEEETANVNSGLLAIVPRTYRVIGGSEVHGTQPGGEFEAALPMGNEALLLEGGHIELVEQPATKTTKKKEK
jgi:hypothetical protein